MFKILLSSDSDLIIFFFLIYFGPIILIILIMILIALLPKRMKKAIKNYFGVVNNKSLLLIDKNIRFLPQKVDYFREIPCNGDIKKIYLVAKEYNIEYEEQLNENLIGAVLLQWLNKDYIKIIEEKGKYKIDLSKFPETSDRLEKYLYLILHSAAGENELLEVNELTNWNILNYAYLKSFFLSINTYAIEAYEKEGVIENSCVNNRQFYEDGLKIVGLKKYLSDFSKMSKKESIEVKLWDDYLAFAELFGIAEVVQNELKSSHIEFNTYNIIGTLSVNIYKEYELSRKKDANPDKIEYLYDD